MMRELVAALFLSIALPAHVSMGRSVVSAQQQSNTTSDRIVGAVINATDSRALPSTIVSLRSEHGVRSTVTDDEGRFAFEHLQPGRYTVTAEKPGYLSSSFGATYIGGAGKPIIVDSSTTDRENLVIKLQRGSVVTGLITGPDGSSATNVQVSLEGRRESVRTDDRGVYRIWGLPPGEYVIAANPKFGIVDAGTVAIRTIDEVDRILARLRASTFGAAAQPGPGPINSHTDDVPLNQPTPSQGGFAKVFYPGTLDPSMAAKVQLGPGEELAGLDFSLILSGTTELRGTVYDRGAVVSGATVSAVPSRAEATIRPITTTTDKDGNFIVRNVQPGGQYRVEARLIDHPRALTAGVGSRQYAVNTRRWAATEVQAADGGVSGIDLHLQPALGISGRVTLPARSNTRADLARMRIDVTPWARQAASPVIVNTTITSDGRFQVVGLLPGRYLLKASIPNSPLTLRSAIVDGRDILDVPFDVDTEHTLTNLSLVFAEASAGLTGIVEGVDATGDGISVIVVPTDRVFWYPDSPRIVTGAVASDGSFDFTHLHAGEYFVAAAVVDGPNAVTSTQFLEAVVKDALRIVLRDGDSKRIRMQFRR